MITISGKLPYLCHICGVYCKLQKKFPFGKIFFFFVIIILYFFLIFWFFIWISFCDFVNHVNKLEISINLKIIYLITIRTKVLSFLQTLQLAISGKSCFTIPHKSLHFFEPSIQIPPTCDFNWPSLSSVYSTVKHERHPWLFFIVDGEPLVSKPVKHSIPRSKKINYFRRSTI